MLKPRVIIEKNRVEIIQTKISSEDVYNKFLNFLKQRDYNIRETSTGCIVGHDSVYFMTSRADWIQDREKKTYSTLVIRLAESAPKNMGLEIVMNKFAKDIKSRYKLD